MSWMELDDGILDHPKFIRAVKLAGSDSVFLWLGLRAHCAKLLTDGLIAEDMIDEVRGPKDPKKRAAALQALRDARLIDPDPEGVRMHNYLKWSKSRAQVLAQREAARARQTKFRGGSDGGNSNAGSNVGSNGVTSGVTSRAVPRIPGGERSGVGEALDLGSGSGSRDQEAARDLQTRAACWISDPNGASLSDPNPEKWPETKLLVATLTDVFGGPEQVPRSPADPRMRTVLQRWAEGRTTEELVLAIRGAGKDDQLRAKPQLQTLSTILRDSGQVDRYARLLTVSAVVLASPGRPQTGRAGEALERQAARASAAREQEAKALP